MFELYELCVHMISTLIYVLEDSNPQAPMTTKVMMQECPQQETLETAWSNVSVYCKATTH